MGQSAEELREEIEGTREHLGETIDAIGDRVSPKRMVERRRARIGEGLTAVRERVMGSASDVGDRASSMGGNATDRVHDVTDAVRSAPESAIRRTQGNPLAAGLIAFGGGLLLAALFPGTEAEARAATALKEKVQPLADQAKEAGQSMASSLQESGQQALEAVKETAQEGAQQVADTARASAQDTAGAGREAAQTVRDDASSSLGTGA